MKKIYSLFFAMAGVATLLAQNTLPIEYHVSYPSWAKPVNITKVNPDKNNVQNTNGFWIDYDYAENQQFPSATTTPGAGYRRSLVPFNNAYDGSTPSDDKFGAYIIRYFIVGFDSILDSYSSVGYDKSQVTAMTIDSVGFSIGHSNYSGDNDTLLVNIISLANKGAYKDYPTTTVLHSLTPLVTNVGISPSNVSNDGNAIQTIIMPVGYTLPNGVKKFGVKLDFHGDRADTCALLVGFNDEQGNGVQCQAKPLESLFALSNWHLHGSSNLNGSTYSWNDWFVDTVYSVSGGTNIITDPLPTSASGNLYTECDGANPSGWSAGDGESFIQNASIAVYVTITTTGMEEMRSKGVYVQQNVPNPFNGTSTINYQLADNKNVKLEVFDITGKKIMNVEEGNQSAGMHAITINASNLNAGVYFYTLTAGDVRITKRMTIVE